ncbi:hypothetical protein AJ80_07384 [Polytolypa hystricis UAMH7299]|uniref:Uncharacterized protein n=1 Tax=Polytolypa hystricis (strain UAMH7299) TaxID=1447883 RepID=A0A2B7XPZ1_POLH7|nr:hypothetical protein AJ80_07384 [Polytolypa hystricis UAMH7299]
MQPARTEGSELSSPHSPPSTPFQCSVCFKSYKRREHLQRHVSSHSSERPHRCAACGGAFQRADVLKRHVRTCDGRPSGSSRASIRRRACDRCVRQKKACNGTQPCQNCSKRATACSYFTGTNAVNNPIPARLPLSASTATPFIPTPLDLEPDLLSQGRTDQDPLSSAIDAMMPSSLEVPQFRHLPMNPFEPLSDPDMFDYRTSNWQDIFYLTPDGHTAREQPVTGGDGPYRFEFLRDFTSMTGFVHSFDCGTPQQRHDVLAKIKECEPQEVMLAGQDATSGALDGVLSSWLNDPLALKTHQILLLIKQVVTVKPRNSFVTISWSSTLEQKCLQFFSPASLRKFFELYWSIWSPNVNFLHRPTFDPTSSKPILLAAMALIGACVSPDPTDNENASIWFNCVEELVFTDEDLNSEPPYIFNSPTYRQKLQALQAGYMVCLYQNWEGTDANKSRIRRYRYSTVVSIIRDLDVATARHINYSQQGLHEFKWNHYVLREELIRIIIWTYLLDMAFVIFNNLPPRIVLKEMRNHVAGPETCFQATSAEECFQQIQMWMPAYSLFWKISFRSIFEHACDPDLSMDMRHTFAAVGPVNLFAMTSGIHALVFQYQNSFGGNELLQGIRNALGNWNDIWNLYISTPPENSPYLTVSVPDNDSLRPEEMWKRIGFSRFSRDYWLLASLKVDKLSAAADKNSNFSPLHQSGSEAMTESSPENDVEHLSGDSPQDPILNKYDQTSMRQVNDLIQDFEKIHVQ